MKKESFYEQLSQYAELASPKIRKLKSEEDHVEQITKYDENGKDMTYFISVNDNVTLPIELKALNVVRDCEDCGKRSVNNRVVSIRLVSQPVPHKRKYCNHCKKFFNPETQQFDLHAVSKSHFLNKFPKNDK